MNNNEIFITPQWNPDVYSICCYEPCLSRFQNIGEIVCCLCCSKASKVACILFFFSVIRATIFAGLLMPCGVRLTVTISINSDYNNHNSDNDCNSNDNIMVTMMLRIMSNCF